MAAQALTNSRPPVIHAAALGGPGTSGNRRTSVRHFRWWLVAAVGVFAAATVLFLFNPAEHSFYPYCVLYRSTGFQCAGCGSLRALHSLLHGQWQAAFGHNPLLVATLPLWLYLIARMVLRAAGLHLKPLRVRPWWLLAGGVGLLVYTVLRNF